MAPSVGLVQAVLIISTYGSSITGVESLLRSMGDPSWVAMIVQLLFCCISGPLGVLLLSVVSSYSSTHWLAVLGSIQCGRVFFEAVVQSGIGGAGGGAPAAVGRGTLMSR